MDNDKKKERYQYKDVLAFSNFSLQENDKTRQFCFVGFHHQFFSGFHHQAYSSLLSKMKDTSSS